MQTKRNLQTKAAMISQSIGEHERALTELTSGLDQTNDVEANAIKFSAETRKRCHDEVDDFFDSLEEETKSQTSETRRKFKFQQRQMKWKLDKLRRKNDAISQMISVDDAKLATDGDSLLREAQRYVESLSPPVIDVHVPAIRLERNRAWKASDAVNVTGITIKPTVQNIKSVSRPQLHINTYR